MGRNTDCHEYSTSLHHWILLDLIDYYSKIVRAAICIAREKQGMQIYIHIICYICTAVEHTYI